MFNTLLVAQFKGWFGTFPVESSSVFFKKSETVKQKKTI